MCFPMGVIYSRVAQTGQNLPHGNTETAQNTQGATCVHILQAVKPSYILIYPGPEKILHIPITETVQI